MTEINNIVFDIGNVLFRWEPQNAIKSIFPDSFDALEKLKEIDFFNLNFQLDMGREPENLLAELKVKDELKHLVLKTYLENVELANINSIDGVEKIIISLKDAGYRLYALSNMAIHTFNKILPVSPILTYFENIVISGAIGVAKPDEKMFEYLTNTYQILASQTLFIDDLNENCVAAEKLGFQTVQFKTASSLELNLRQLSIL